MPPSTAPFSSTQAAPPTPVIDWKKPPSPNPAGLHGRYVTLRPIAPDIDAEPLLAAAEGPGSDPDQWTYLAHGPFHTQAAMRAHLEACARSPDPYFFTIALRDTQRPVGICAYMRITPEHGSIEIGSLAFTAAMQRQPAATETIYLMAAHAFDLGYRRLEWKCNARNLRSQRAAIRYGFTPEGIFRQHQVDKNGNNRDTCWFSMLDSEWPTQRRFFEQWLQPDNFSGDGRQIRSLDQIRQQGF